jgi:hypothetical protein
VDAVTGLAEIERIAADRALTVGARNERVTALLAQCGSDGVGVAVECLLETVDPAVAEYVASYLEVVPDAHEAKTRAAQRLLGMPELAGSAARLVPWLPPDLLDRIARDHHAAAGSPYRSVVFNLAAYFPERLRPYADRIEDPFVRQALLSGAGDDVADALLDQWKNDGDLNHLTRLAFIRTGHAADLIAATRDDVRDPEDWEWLMPLAGRMPDTSRSAGYRPAFAGFVAGQGASNHVIGGAYPAEVPLCVDCGTPAERVLTLSAADLPHGLSRDPSFFWFACECDEVDIIAVRFIDADTHVLFNPQGPPAAEPRLIPVERSMILTPHPNQTGVAMPAVPTATHHQIGGLPRWPSPETHPICGQCGNYMPFLAATTVGPGLLLFGFWCDPCAVSSTQIQA